MKKIGIGSLIVLLVLFGFLTWLCVASYNASEERMYPSSYDIRKDADVREYYSNEQEFQSVIHRATGIPKESLGAFLHKQILPEEILGFYSLRYIPDDKKMRLHLKPEFKWGFRGPWDFQVAFESKIQHWGDFRIENWHLRNYPGIGIKMEYEPATADSGGVPGSVVVKEVDKGFPAEKSGLKPGDRILEVSGKQVSKPEEVGEIIRKHKIGDVVKLRIISAETREYKIVEVSVSPLTFSTDPKNPQDTELRLISSEKAWHQNCPVRFIFTLWEEYNLKGLDTKGREYAVECLKIRTAIPQGNFDYNRLRKGDMDDLSKVLLQAQNTGLPVKIKGVIFGMGYIDSEDKKDTIEELTIDLLVTSAEIQR